MARDTFQWNQDLECRPSARAGVDRERSAETGRPLSHADQSESLAVRLGRSRVDTSNMERAVRATGAPLEALDIEGEAPREIYGFDLLLVRPDLHIVWRGSQVPDDSEIIAAVATGRRFRPPSGT